MTESVTQLDNGGDLSFQVVENQNGKQIATSTLLHGQRTGQSSNSHSSDVRFFSKYGIYFLLLLVLALGAHQPVQYLTHTELATIPALDLDYQIQPLQTRSMELPSKPTSIHLAIASSKAEPVIDHTTYTTSTKYTLDLDQNEKEPSTVSHLSDDKQPIRPFVKDAALASLKPVVKKANLKNVQALPTKVIKAMSMQALPDQLNRQLTSSEAETVTSISDETIDLIVARVKAKEVNEVDLKPETEHQNSAPKLRDVKMEKPVLAVAERTPLSKAFQMEIFQQLQAQARAENKPFFIRFTAKWCVPCKVMEENTLKDPQLAAHIETHYLTSSLDIQSFDGVGLKKTFDVKRLPAILFFDQEGQLLKHQKGALTANQFMLVLEEIQGMTPVTERTVYSESDEQEEEFGRD